MNNFYVIVGSRLAGQTETDVLGQIAKMPLKSPLG